MTLVSVRMLQAREARHFRLHLNKLRERKLLEIEMQSLARINANSQGLMFFKRQA